MVGMEMGETKRTSCRRGHGACREMCWRLLLVVVVVWLCESESRCKNERMEDGIR